MIGPDRRPARAGDRFSFWLLCLAVWMGIAAIVRAVLSVIAVREGPAIASRLSEAWAVGIVDDAATAVVLGLPFLAGLYLLARPLRWRWVAALAHLALFALGGVAVFAAVAEVFFWLEFNGRFNGIAVYYLIFPKEVIGNIRESFDMRLVLPPVAIAAVAVYLILRRGLGRALAAPVEPRTLGRDALVTAAAGLAALAVLWSGPFEPTPYRTANEMAANGMHVLLRAFLTNDEKYEGVYAGIDEREAIPIVRAMVRQDNTTDIAPLGARSVLRRVDNGPPPRKRLNVVLVLEESFGSVYFEDVYEERQRDFHRLISPNWHRLAGDGLLFTNVYATGDRTVRALEAVLTSFPPIPGISTARRAGSEGMNSLPFLLRNFGYRTEFLYGGPTVFDNMGHFWSTIGFEKVMGEADIAEKGFTTIWGSADEYLFAEALKRIDALAATPQPFLMGLLTVTNHRPFLFPEGRVPFKPARNQRDHSAAYADWALGAFIDAARKRPWFDDTVFVMLGDHGPKLWGAAQIPVQAFRVPVLFLAPKHLAAGRSAVLGSSLDIAPTLLGILGLSYDSPFFGVDLRRVPADGGRIAIAHNFDVAVGDGRHVALLTPKGDVRPFAMRPGPHQFEPVGAIPDDATRRAVALTQTAHRMFYAREYHELVAAGRDAPPPRAAADLGRLPP